MSGKLEGKIALVTGGTAGIGLATARRFVKEGAYVFVTGRRRAELDAAAKLMSGHVTAVKADASKLDDLDKLFAQIKREKWRLLRRMKNSGGSFIPFSLCKCRWGAWGSRMKLLKWRSSLLPTIQAS